MLTVGKIQSSKYGRSCRVRHSILADIHTDKASGRTDGSWSQHFKRSSHMRFACSSESGSSSGRLGGVLLKIAPKIPISPWCSEYGTLPVIISCVVLNDKINWCY